MSRDTSFYYSFLVLPARKRQAIVAVWDFCRAVDDAVDEAVPSGEWHGGPGTKLANTPPGAAATLALAEWRTELGRCYGGEVPVTRQGQALQPFIAEFHLPRAAFDDLIIGVEMDLHTATYPSFEALVDYCRHVASTVGLICIEIFGHRDPGTREYAINLGIALQLTNIIRDIAGDLARNRVYVPAEDLQRFGCSRSDLEAGRVTPNVRALIEFQCARAREYYERAARALPQVDARSLVAAEIMGGIYKAILRRIERADCDVFSRVIRVPRPMRALIAVRIWLRTMVRF